MRLPLHLLVSSLPMCLLARPVQADEWNNLKSCVAGTDDVDRDGRPDLLVASRCNLPPNYAWVLSGRDGSVIRTVCGVTTGFGFPTALVGCGDVDLDGWPDTMVSTFCGSASSFGGAFHGGFPVHLGSAFVHSGRTGELLLEIPDVLYALGTADVDADGRVDLAVGTIRSEGTRRVRIRAANGAPSYEIDAQNWSKAVRLHSGVDGSLLYEVPPLCSPADEEFGCSFANLGDVDGDARTDFAVGSVNMLNPSSRGHVFRYSGRDGLLMDAVEGDFGLDGYGWSLASIGDIDNDGRSDVLVGAASRCVDVRSGSDLRLIHRLDAKYRYAVYDAFASSLDPVGDVDFDCVPDFVVGANEDPQPFDQGYVWLVSGRTGRVLRELARSDDQGFDACGAGDVDADGVPDVALATESKFNGHHSFPAGREEFVEQDHKVRILSGRTWETVWEVDLNALRKRTIEGREQK